MTRVKLGSFVQVDWHDASSSATVPFNAERDHKPIVMHTRGWVLACNRDGISVANETYREEGNDHFRGWTFIPNGMVVRVKRVAR
jgi:hypothetical protein